MVAASAVESDCPNMKPFGFKLTMGFYRFILNEMGLPLNPLSGMSIGLGQIIEGSPMKKKYPLFITPGDKVRGGEQIGFRMSDPSFRTGKREGKIRIFCGDPQ